MKIFLSKVFIFLLLLNVNAVYAAAYQGDEKDLPRLNNLINILNVQQQELQRLVKMLERLETWKTTLTSDNKKLAEEGELLKLDKEKHKNKEMSDSEFNKKWVDTRRSVEHANQLVLFQADVKKFNAFVQEYNALTVKMDRVLSKRSPKQVTRLIKDIQRLMDNMKAALKESNITKAKFIAKQSEVAAEFGYVSD